MRYFIIIILCLISLLAGCEALTAPFSLVQELLPIAIKYAPYALMFLEAPEEIENFKNNKIYIKYSEEKLKTKFVKEDLLCNAVEEKLRKNKNVKFIYIVPLKNINNLNKFLGNDKGKSSYIITYLPEDMKSENFIKLSKSIKNVDFFIKDI